jgi:hypothetical protein
MKSMISNMTRMGVIVTPITCVTLGDVMKSLSVMLRNATAAGGGNETNSTQGIDDEPDGARNEVWDAEYKSK